MKYIITGSNGFIGSHIADLLSSNKKNSVIELDKSSNVNNKKNFIKTDLKNKKILNKIISKNDIILHFAGMADIEDCKKNPIKTIDENIKITINLANIALKKNVKKFVFASTLYVHSNSGSFYKASKFATEKYLEEFSKLGLNLLILRFGSLYGPRAGKNNSMYKIVKQILDNKNITYFGDGNEKREFINVYDAARSTVELLKRNYKNKKLTISGNEKLTYNELFELLSEVVSKKIKVIKKKKKTKDHYNYTPYNVSLEKNEKYISNFNIDFGQGISDYIEYLKNNRF